MLILRDRYSIASKRKSYRKINIFTQTDKLSNCRIGWHRRSHQLAIRSTAERENGIFQKMEQLQLCRMPHCSSSRSAFFLFLFIFIFLSFSRSGAVTSYQFLGHSAARSPHFPFLLFAHFYTFCFGPFASCSAKLSPCLSVPRVSDLISAAAHEQLHLPTHTRLKRSRLATVTAQCNPAHSHYRRYYLQIHRSHGWSFSISSACSGVQIASWQVNCLMLRSLSPGNLHINLITDTLKLFTPAVVEVLRHAPIGRQRLVSRCSRVTQ